jgi:hypothetical protein
LRLCILPQAAAKVIIVLVQGTRNSRQDWGRRWHEHLQLGFPSPLAPSGFGSAVPLENRLPSLILQNGETDTPPDPSMTSLRFLLSFHLTVPFSFFCWVLCFLLSLVSAFMLVARINTRFPSVGPGGGCQRVVVDRLLPMSVTSLPCPSFIPPAPILVDCCLSAPLTLAALIRPTSISQLVSPPHLTLVLCVPRDHAEES